MSVDPSRETMQSVLRTLSALEAIARLQPVRMSDLARELQLPKTTVSRILKTLRQAGWAAAQDDVADARWVLTARALAVGSSVTSESVLRAVAQPRLAWLGEQTDENVHLSVPDGDTLVLIDKVPSGRPVQTLTRVGDKAPMYLTASGWAFLSRLPREEIEVFLPEKLVALTDRTIVKRDQLLHEIGKVAEIGYAVNPGRWRPDVAAIAAAVVNRAGRPIAAISISMPAYRLTPDVEKPYGNLVRQATAEVSRELAGQTPQP